MPLIGTCRSQLSAFAEGAASYPALRRTGTVRGGMTRFWGATGSGHDRAGLVLVVASAGDDRLQRLDPVDPSVAVAPMTPVGTGAAVEAVIAEVASQVVLARAAKQLIGQSIDGPGAAARYPDFAPVTGVQYVVPAASFDVVGPARGLDEVVARPALDTIATGTGHGCVVACTEMEDVGPMVDGA
jgi:hypothetical protein